MTDSYCCRGGQKITALNWYSGRESNPQGFPITDFTPLFRRQTRLPLYKFYLISMIYTKPLYVYVVSNQVKNMKIKISCNECKKKLKKTIGK